MACPLNIGALLVFLCSLPQQVGLESTKGLYWAGDSNGQVVCIENLSYPPGKGEEISPSAGQMPPLNWALHQGYKYRIDPSLFPQYLMKKGCRAADFFFISTSFFLFVCLYFI